MKINILIYCLIFASAIINLIALVRHKKQPDDNATTIKLSKTIVTANYLVVANIIFSIISVIIKLCGIINFETYLVLMYISHLLIVVGSLDGLYGVIAQLIRLRRSNQLAELQTNPKMRIRLLLQMLMFAFGITWLATDYLMISFTWMDFFLHLITFEPVQQMPVQGIIYFSLIYLVSIYKITDLLHFKYWRKK